MRLDFEKFLNDNGLKIGDKVKSSDECRIYEIIKNEVGIFLNCENSYLPISELQYHDFELLSKKKIGELICYDIAEPRICNECPLQCITCGGYTHDTLRERFEETLKEYPQLEPMRPYLEKELDKEVEN